MSDISYVGLQAKSFTVSPKFDAYSKVALVVTDKLEYVAGDDTGRTLTIECPWGSQAMANKILTRIKGFEYQPYEAEGALLNPAAELGDGITAKNVYSGVYSAETSFDSLYSSKVIAPAEEEIDHEYPYVSSSEKKITRKINNLYSEFQVQAGLISAKVGTTGGTQESFGWELDAASWALYANNAEVFKADKTGVTVTGIIKATEGAIGKWLLKDGRLYATYGEDAKMTVLQPPSSDITYVFAAGGTDPIDFSEYPFRVTGAGKLYATDAEIEGKITSEEGSIGGWNLDENSLYSGKSFTSATCFVCTGSTAPFNIGGSGSIADWMLKAGSNFGVTADGSMYASAVNITGGSLRVVSENLNSAGVIIAGKNGLGVTTETFNIEAKQGHAFWLSNNMLRYESGPMQASSVLIWVEEDLNGIKPRLVGTWYTDSGYVVTSDRNAKYDIVEQPDVYSQLFDRLKPVLFKYRDGTSGRTHTGFIAQDVEEAVKAVGLTTQEFAAVCFGANETGDSSGYGIRYEEFVSLNTHEIQKLKTRVSQLEKLLKEEVS